ncbi:hypothetical protein [Pseudoscardovia radai]|uniref:hypothetical protein n=1 Tax=Pseudoscardovia radai TaxID=987066 RepID=UPI003992C108
MNGHNNTNDDGIDGGAIGSDGVGRMHLRGVLGEAWRDIASGTTHAALFAMVLAVLMVAGCVMEATSLSHIDAERSSFVASGASTYVLTYSGHVSATVCERLGDAQGVLAAGAVRQASSRLTMAKLPSTTVPTWDATPGAIRLFASSDSDSAPQLDAVDYEGVWMSQQAAQATGSAVHTEQPLAGGGTVQVSGVYPFPDDGRDTANFSYAALQAVPAQSDGFDACIVKTWPVPSDVESLLMYTVARTSGESSSYPAMSQLNATEGSQFHPENEFAGRVSAWAPLVLGIAGLLLGFICVRLRRLELASAMHCGVPKVAMMTQMLVESAVWALAAAVIGFAAIAFLRMGWTGDDLAAVDDDLLRVPVAALAGVCVGVFVATLCVREKSMFRYFKNR